MKDYDNFFLGVTDIEQGKKYYKDILGLSLKFDFTDKGMIAFKVGDQEPSIILKDLKCFLTLNQLSGLWLMTLKKNMKS
jgi:catechol 2,3-dioxygenase-like lactoylglutathione lyase family enzyme